MVWLQISTVFWLGGGTISKLLNGRGFHGVRQTETETRSPEPLVPEPSALETEKATGKLKRHRSPGIDQIPAELIKVVGRTIFFRSVNSVTLGIRRNWMRSGRS